MSDQEFVFKIGDSTALKLNSDPELDVDVRVNVVPVSTTVVGIRDDIKQALLNCFQHVAWIDEHGQDYYDALDAALNTKVLLSITAVYMQTGAVYDTDSLDSLKADLVVTAYYDDGTTANVTSLCTLSGTLTAGTSTITATYQEMTASFTVTVQHLYAFENGTHTFSNGHYITVTEGHIVYGELVSSSTISMVANASTISDNTTTANTQDNNTSSEKLFDVSAGSVISWEITPLQVDYSGAKQGQKYINMTLKSMNEGVVSHIVAMFNKVINTITVGTPITGSYTAEGDTEVWLVGSFFEKSSSLTLKAKFDVKIYVDGVRYV